MSSSFSLTQQRALAIVPKVTGFASLIFSSLIVFTVLRDGRKRSKVFHRLLCGISLVDMSSSFWLGLSTWPIPKNEATLWASGTTGTCSAQGFFTQFGIASSFYNASLSIYYLVVICHGWKEAKIMRMEKHLHGIPLFWGLSTAIAGLPLTLYNNANLWCWIASLPSGCKDGECTRGRYADIFRWVFFYGPLWCMILIVTINVILIFLHVWRVERSSNRYRFKSSVNRTTREEDEEQIETRDQFQENKTPYVSSSVPRALSEESNRHAKKVAMRCFMYAGAFYFNWIALTIVRIQQSIHGGTPAFALLLLATISTPMQGLPNFLVYLGPKFRRLRRKYPHAGLWNWFKQSLAPENDQALDSSSSLENVESSSEL